MTESPSGSASTPQSSNPYPELSYDAHGRPVTGSPYAVTGPVPGASDPWGAASPAPPSGSPSYGSAPYGSPSSYGSGPAASDPYSTTPYGSSSSGTAPYGGAWPHSSGPSYTGAPHGDPSSYGGASAYGSAQYGGGSYAGGSGQISQPYYQQQDPTLTVIAWIVAVLTGFYMLPWAVAVTRRAGNATTIAIVTALTAWTGIGWIVCFIWSCVSEPASSFTAPPGWYPSSTGTGTQYWDGRSWTGHTQP